MLKGCALALLALTAAVAVSAADDEKKPEAEKEKVICKSDGVTGSRLKKRRTCMTRAQWDALAAKTKQSIDDYSRTQGASVQAAKGPFDQ